MDALINTNKFMPFVQLGPDIDGEVADDESGFSVSLSGDGQRVAIGARKNDASASGSGIQSGHVRVYKRNGTDWDQMGADIDGEAAGDMSGFSVSLSTDGETVAIGAPYHDNSTGHVKVYSFETITNTWVQSGSDIDGKAAGDQSGWSVSLSDDGQKVAIGAAYNDGNGHTSGHVSIYTWIEDDGWVQRGADIGGEASFDKSGTSVSLSGDGETVAIGAPHNYGSGIQSGHVRIYTWSPNGWVQRGSDIDGEAPGDKSGSSVSLSTNGETVAIGAKNNSGGGNSRGHVRVYKHEVTGWVQRGPDIEGYGDYDISGNSVCLSGDGETVAIGAAYNNNGPGYVKVYSWETTTNTWVERGHIDGEAAGDESGTSVSLSTDGQTVAIGARNHDNSTGHVKVYMWNEDGTWVASVSADPYIMTVF